MDLIPPTRKHTFAPDIDPSTIIDDEARFKAFTGINWATSDFQMMGEDEESAQDDPEPSTRRDQDNRSKGRLVNCRVEFVHRKTLILLGCLTPCNRLAENNDRPCHRASLFA